MSGNLCFNGNLFSIAGYKILYIRNLLKLKTYNNKLIYIQENRFSRQAISISTDLKW